MKDLTNFIYELGMTKKFRHGGIHFAGVQNPDSLAEHIMRASQIAFILAELEGADMLKSAMMCLIHDNAEIRIGDQHRIARYYLGNTLKSEYQAFKDQIQDLPPKSKEIFNKFFKEFLEQKTLESHVARDSDLLETIFQAKEYLDIGHKGCKRWVENGGKHLKTKSAKKIFAKLKKIEFTEWWNALNIVRNP